MRRRVVLLGVLGAGVGLGGAQAQTPAAGFPARGVRIIVPYAAGGGSDIVGRILAAQAGQATGLPFSVENRGGGASIPGTQAIVVAPPDGTTVGIVDLALVVNPAMFGARLPYDTLRDLAPVGVLVTAPTVMLAHHAAPARSVVEVVAAARARPGAVSLAHAGTGTANHLASVQFQLAAGLEVVQVSYRGGGPTVTAVVTGEVPYGFGAIPTAKGHIDEGRIRALAVAGPDRSPALPDTPTFAELGLPGVDVVGFWGLVAPAGVPAPVLERLHALLVAPAREATVAARLEGLGYAVVAGSRQDFAAMVEREVAKWRVVIGQAGIVPD